MASAQRHGWTYDVFVSFRGDIRKSFMDHLFKDFREKGINAFRDDNENLRGEELPPELYKAIEESWFLIVVFSKKFASSSWCLRELEKILECKRMAEPKHEVRIVFYDVKPEVVRKQTGSYAKAFIKHEISNTTEQVVKWKKALREATDIIGCDLQDFANGYESKLIDHISKDILDMTYKIRSTNVGGNLVGVDDHIEEMDLSRFNGPDKVHMLGICGISGIGKTTLAKAIYNKMCMDFKGCCFFENVQGVAKTKSITEVQMQIINSILKTRVETITNVSDGIKLIKERMASKPILLVLDDVDHREQLEALAGSRDWFFPGSFIIFTGKDQQLLRSHRVDDIYGMPVLPGNKAMELFSLYAFGKHLPTKDFIRVSNQVVDCLQGHPLALRVLGACLYKKPMHVWQSEVDKLQTCPKEDIQKKLRPSFDGLDFNEKRIFLDIACSLIGENKDIVASVLGNGNSFAYADMEVLANKSLITISRDGNSLQMHELIRSMARRIMHEELVVNKVWSRLWNLSDVCNELRKNKAIEVVEVIDFFLKESSQNIYIDGDAFEAMKNLRILKICEVELGEVWYPSALKLMDSKVTYFGRLKSLSNKLRLLYWHGCPFEFPSDFYPANIVAIDLSYSHLKTLWTTPKCFERLKVMKLRHCRNLTNTPDFTMITNLEELILEGCVNLVKVHPSLWMHKKLVVLNMRDCKRFRRFPCKVEMDSLEVLDLYGCSKVDKLPEFFSTIQTFWEFSFDGTAIMELPTFVSSLCNLIFPSLKQPSKQSWFNSIAQSDLLSVALGEKPARFLPAQKLFGVDKYLETQRYQTYRDVSDNLRDMIYTRFCDLVACSSNSKGLCIHNGSFSSFSLRKNKCTDLLWSVNELEFYQILLIWHIATTLCYYSEVNVNDPFEINRIESKHISEYLLNLLISNPEMLPVGIGIIRYRDTFADAMRFFKTKGPMTDKAEACRKLLEVDCKELPPRVVKGDRSKSVLFDGCRLALDLREMERGPMWKVVSQVWIEILAYAAADCRGVLHSQQLGRGGGFLTHVWLLMVHLGTTEHFLVSQGHARARFNVS